MALGESETKKDHPDLFQFTPAEERGTLPTERPNNIPHLIAKAQLPS